MLTPLERIEPLWLGHLPQAALSVPPQWRLNVDIGLLGDVQIAAMFERTAWTLPTPCVENVNRTCGSFGLSRATL